MSPIDSLRRRFLVRAAIVTTLPFIAPFSSGMAHAQQLKPLSTDNPQAKLLAYHEDAKSVKHENFKAGSDCGNCQFFTSATGACVLFPGFRVPAKAWCSAWAIKA